MDTNLYISTSAGIISRNAVSYIQTEIKGMVKIFVIGRALPIVLTGEESSVFVEMLQPVVTVVQANED